MTANKHVNVMGYLANNFHGINEAVPALIINPEATPLDMLAWCWGEIVSMQSSLDSLASASAPLEPGELSAIFLHRIAPLERVMHEAVCALIQQQKSTTGGA